MYQVCNSEEEAAAVVAKAKGVRVKTSLRTALKTKQGRARPRVQHVAWYTARSCWITRVPSDKYQKKYFASREDAVPQRDSYSSHESRSGAFQCKVKVSLGISVGMLSMRSGVPASRCTVLSMRSGVPCVPASRRPGVFILSFHLTAIETVLVQVSLTLTRLQVKYVTARTKTKASELEKQAVSRKSHGNLSKQAARFKALWRVYSRNRHGRRCEALPSDLKAAIQFRRKHGQVFRRCPALYVASLKGKETPWYQAVQSAWQDYCKCSGVPTSSVPDADVAAILQSAAQKMEGVDRTMFTQNIGRNVSHHMGWLAFMLSKKLLRKHKGSRRSGVLTFGENSYQKAPITKRARLIMSDMHATGSVLLDLPVPRSTDDWNACIAHAQQMAPKSEVRNPYHWPWLLRSSMISAMRVARISRLQCPKDFTIGKLRRMFPDQRQHLTRFGQPSDTVRKLCTTLGYDGPVELLTMHMCMFCSKTMEHVCPQQVHESHDSLVSKREHYEQVNGVVPHCSWVGRWLLE